MKKKTTAVWTAVLAGTLMAGCGNQIPDLTAQQEALVVEYAAGTVLKYDKNYESRLVEITLEEEAPLLEETAEEEPAPTHEMNQAEDVEVIDNTETIDNTTHTIDSFLQLDEVKITYTGYETDSFYPNEVSGEEFYFVMNASEGTKLLVLKFRAENMSGTDTELDIAKQNVKFKIAVDGETKNALTTMLLNDLAYYQGTLTAGESVELVLVCEIPDEQAEGISSLELSMQSVDNSATISLN